MIPAAFPGARILLFTYPKLSAENAEEYLDKVTQKLFDSLSKARAKLTSNTTPIVFIGYGFGGLVLQKLLVLSIAAHEKNTEESQVLNMTAGLVFLDTPFPAAKQDEKSETHIFLAPMHGRHTSWKDLKNMEIDLTSRRYGKPLTRKGRYLTGSFRSFGSIHLR